MDWYVRELNEGDAESVLDAFRSDPDMVRQGNVTTLGEASTYITNLTSEPRQALVAADRKTDRVYALAGVAVDTENSSGWVFYWSHKTIRRSGVTSSLVTQFCNTLLDKGLHRLELGYRVNNPGSAHVARRAGFIVEGCEREKFLVNGERIDVETCGRLATDPWPNE